jgi:DNA-binding LacI/PurR family transcriptional regulator
MQRLLPASPAEAYLCGDDLLAVGALSAILDAGLKVPDDIGLIDLNDIQMARWQNNGLTTIRQPIDQITSAAIDLVIAAKASPTLPPQTCIFPCTLIERQTLRPARA